MEKERYWTFIMYPQSMDKDINAIEYLQATGLKIAISPLHNKDLNQDGEQKKEHYHVLLCFEGPTTYNRVEKITKQVNATIPQRVISPIGCIRYMTHKDNPEKAQYDERDIKTLNGLDIQDICGITTSMELELKKGIIQLIQAKNITEYSTLINYLIKEDLKDMFKIASSNTIFYNSYIKSRRFNIDEELKKI